MIFFLKEYIKHQLYEKKNSMENNLFKTCQLGKKIE